MPLNNLALRSLTGFFFGAVMISTCYLPVIWQIPVYGTIMVLAIREFIHFFNGNESIHLDKVSAYFLQIIIFLILVSGYIVEVHVALLWVIVPVVFLVILNELWRNVENPILNISLLVFGAGYTLLPFYMILALADLSQKYAYIFPLALGMYLLIWTNDTFAYLSGRLFGKRPLFSRISPKKTWEGTIGGLLFTLLIGYVLFLTTNELPLTFWIVSALIVAPAAIVGDLLESLFKRSVGVKDSGALLPGHGGILDRFDAVLFTVPFYYFWSLFYIHYIA